MKTEADGVREIALLVNYQVITEVGATPHHHLWTDMQQTIANMDHRQHLLPATMNPIVTMIIMLPGDVVVEDAVPTIIMNEDLDEDAAGHRQYHDDVHLVMMRTITAIDADRNETIHDHPALRAALVVIADAEVRHHQPIEGGDHLLDPIPEVHRGIDVVVADMRIFEKNAVKALPDPDPKRDRGVPADTTIMLNRTWMTLP